MKVFDRAKVLIDYSMSITDNVKRYPKKYRFTFVDRIQNLTLDIYKNLSKSNECPVDKRRPLQTEVLGDINVLLALIEISHTRGFIDLRTMEIWTKKVMDVKYMTAAWMKKA